MNLQEIKTALEKGKTVYCSSYIYEVIKDSIGQYLIRCTLNDHCIGLFWADGKTLNGEEKDFYIKSEY